MEPPPPVLTPFTGLADIIKRKNEPSEKEKKKKKKEEEKAVKEKDEQEIDESIEAAMGNLVSRFVKPKIKEHKYDRKTKAEAEDMSIPIPKKRVRGRRKPKTHVGTMAAQIAEDEPPPKKQKNSKAATRNDDDRKAIALLTSYGKNEWLGPYLKDNHDFDLTPQKLRKLKGHKVQELLDDVEDVLSNKRNSALGDGVVRQSMLQLEALVDHRSRFKVDGTTDKCFENEHWRFLLERIKTKHGVGFGKMDPVAELTMVTFQTAAMMHMNNSMTSPTVDLDQEVSVDSL